MHTRMRSLKRNQIITLSTEAEELTKLDDWSLDKDIYLRVCSIFGMRPTIDLAATSASTKCQRFFSEKPDYFKKDWKEQQCYLNPPFDKIEATLKKARKQVRKNTRIRS